MKSLPILSTRLILPLLTALTALHPGQLPACQTLPDQGAAPAAAALANQSAGPVIDVCFVLDTTGSMAGLIESAKQKIWGIADQIARREPAPAVRFALVGFRDRGDAYVTQITPLTDDLDSVYSALLKFQASGGGDGPESVNQALHEAVTKLDWNMAESTRRLVFLAGDAPPHMDYPSDVPYSVTCALAQKRGIRVNALRCGTDGDTEKHWSAIAELGSGEYVSIPANGGTQQIETPFDKEMVSVSAQLNATVIPYGRPRDQAICREKTANAAYGSAEQVASRAAWNTRAGKMQAVSGTEDLTSNLQNEVMKPSDIKREWLPPHLQDKDDAALAALIAERMKARTALQEKLVSLTRQRDAWLASPAAQLLQKSSVFDDRISAMLYAQLDGKCP